MTASFPVLILARFRMTISCWTGASHNVCNNLDIFQSVRALNGPRQITLGDNGVAYCTHIGEVLLCLPRKQYAEGDVNLLLTDVMYD
jgi:hypothetical protein